MASLARHLWVRPPTFAHAGGRARMRSDPAPPAGSLRRVGPDGAAVTPRWGDPVGSAGTAGDTASAPERSPGPARPDRRPGHSRGRGRGRPWWLGLSLERRARRLVRSRPLAQGLVVAFGGRTDDVVTVAVDGAGSVTLRGRRGRPRLVPVDLASPWIVRARLERAGGRGAVVETVVQVPRQGRVELLRLRVDSGVLTCAARTIRFSSE